MRRLLGTFFGFILLTSTSEAQNLLETEKWRVFFEEKPYLEKALKISDESFWDIDQTYTYYTSYPLLLIFSNGASEEVQWSYDGLNNLINKKQQLQDENFERIEKGNLAYIVFDGWLLKNPLPGNAIAGDFMFVYAEGPISLYREYYTSPITHENIESAFAIYKESKLVDNFYLGKFYKKASKLVEDYQGLVKKIDLKILGYTKSQENLLRIANEYNAWVKENNSYRYDDHALLFFQDRF